MTLGHFDGQREEREEEEEGRAVISSRVVSSRVVSSRVVSSRVVSSRVVSSRVVSSPKPKLRKFLDNNDSENETLSADHREQNENNNDRDDDFEEHAIVNFELGVTKRGGVCIWVPIYAQTVAMGSDNALSCMMRRQKKKILGNVDCAAPLAFTIPDKLRIKNGEDIVLYDSRTVRIGEKDVVLVFGSERTLDILSKNSATWHLDGTFKAAPNMWEQCFVVDASVNHRMCIGVWVLLPGKHRRYYEEVLNFLRNRISPVAPRKVICDFEEAEMKTMPKFTML
ncbi:hypothetical protein niasHT_005178 [Heterodera trifolii]|uniref:MULE transposase N-terminal all-beta domain-containing protein n=1 Tax=Heterodera trifolii TaxID=157864 RepID=A0ABD2LRS5_9BILA